MSPGRSAAYSGAEAPVSWRAAIKTKGSGLVYCLLTPYLRASFVSHEMDSKCRPEEAQRIPGQKHRFHGALQSRRRGQALSIAYSPHTYGLHSCQMKWTARVGWAGKPNISRVTRASTRQVLQSCIQNFPIRRVALKRIPHRRRWAYVRHKMARRARMNQCSGGLNYDKCSID